MNDVAPPPRDRRPTFDRQAETPRASERLRGTGVYRRRVIVSHLGDRTWGELEDDFHHFRVDITSKNGAVVSVDGSGVRSPWTQCLTAGTPLQALVGTLLRTGPLALRELNARKNCTHMFDLAGLVVTHAARGLAVERIYDMAVDDPDAGTGERDVRLWRDGELVLEWRLRERQLLGPPEWLDAPLWAGFIEWSGTNLDDDTAEAAVALRRACDISRGRDGDLDKMERADELLDVMSGICHAFQPEIAPLAIRHKGSSRDFTDHPALLLADFDERP
jgi:hypothetical protein